jgi:hypothetical protein
MTTSSEFCAAHGVTRMSLSRWRKAGLVRVTPEGTIDVEATDAALRAAGFGRFKRAEPEPVAPEASLAEAQRQREVALARLRLQRLRELKNQWIPVAMVRVGWKLMRARFEEGLRRLPAQIAEAVDGVESMSAMAAAIETVVYRRMDELANADQGDYFARLEAAMPPEEDAAQQLPDEVPGDTTKVQAEVIKTLAIARKHDLEVEIARGRHVSVAAYIRCMQGVLMSCRQQLLAVPSRLPVYLAGERDRLPVIVGAIEEALAHIPPELPEQLCRNAAPEPEPDEDNDNEPPKAHAKSRRSRKAAA